MSNVPAENFTPNSGLVKDPAKRRVIEVVLGVVGLALGTVIITDASSALFDWSQITIPAAAAFMYVSAGLGFTATLPNIPKR
jgi:hypothetical protein